MIVRINNNEFLKNSRGITHIANKNRSSDLYRNKVDAKPRERVDPSSRSKNVIGTCNR